MRVSRRKFLQGSSASMAAAAAWRAQALHRGGIAYSSGFTLPNAPRDALTATGGDQSYGKNTTSGFTSYAAAGIGTPAYTATQLMGSYNIVASLGASYEGSNVPKQDLVTTIKGGGSHPNLKNQYSPPAVFLYAIMESSTPTGGGYQGLADLIVSQNWWTYVGAGATGGTLTSPNASFSEVNYGYAWPTSIGSASLDAPIAGNVYGSLWNGFGPAETASLYFCDSLLTTNPQYFTSQTNGAAPNANGIFWDNCFSYPGGGGNLGNISGSWDGIGQQTNNSAAAYPSGASSLIARGQWHVLQRMQTYLGSRNPGKQYFNFGNFGNYFNVIGLGSPNTYTSSAVANTWHGGLVEYAFGEGGAAFQGYQTFAQVLQSYNSTMDFCIAPKMVCLGARMPASDGSQTATWRIGGTQTTVTTGTPTEYQCARTAMSFVALDDGVCCFIVSGNRYALLTYYDEQGDDSGSQTNVGKNWLGPRIGGRPTTAAFGNGMWGALFQNGLVVHNPWGNGSQSLSHAQIQAVFPGTWQCISGGQAPTINTGATFTSRTFGDPDGQFFRKVG